MVCVSAVVHISSLVIKMPNPQERVATDPYTSQKKTGALSENSQVRAFSLPGWCTRGCVSLSKQRGRAGGDRCFSTGTDTK